jgi:hypothetical protein
MSQIAGDGTIIELFDPFDGKVEPCSNGYFEVGELHVFGVAFQLLVIGSLVFCNFVPQPSYLFAKTFFHFVMSRFMGSDSFKQSFTYIL